MAAGSRGFLKLSFLICLISIANTFGAAAAAGQWDILAEKSGGAGGNTGGVVAEFPPSCNRIECPGYSVVESGNGYEIRRYNSSVWITTLPIQDISLVDATRTGFFLLFDYIQGKNKYSQPIEMTAPVVIDVLPSDGPICKSSFTASFYVPAKNQANPPPAAGLHVQRWGPTYVAVRQFGGFVADNDVGVEAANLQASLAGTKWADPVAKAGDGGAGKIKYSVAQYNSPFEHSGRVNEIWFSLQM
ncbi:unnamed protein product [Linum tenue]|uniref:SOUL heme-binding protein n=2 Tax=Linum tenue TaxID=586396 RepID=A0AAV0IH42_9ROSI|nr:unnamed protein product [Linum tenue]